MRSIAEIKPRWEATFADRSDIKSLKAAVKEDGGNGPCVKGLRSMCWKAFLLFSDLDKPRWTKVLSDSRSAYASMKEHFLKNIANSENLAADDPLNDSEGSPWNTLRLDEELRAEIWQDVERCMPENAYFREPPTQTMLLDVLFVYCKLNKDIGYRQGMHEVLAPILWVISRDAIDLRSVEKSQVSIDNLALSCLDPKYIEHDAFTLFGTVMQTVKTFYETAYSTSNQSINSGLLNSSPIVERSKRIHEHYLHQTDPELAEHLTAVEILPQIFLIRWLRLIFGREFAFDDVLALWDVIFAEDPNLDLIDLISVSMLLRIRWQLLGADYTEGLTLLLRYPVPPPPHNAPSFVADALYLRDHLSLDGGDHIISKYSARVPETTVTRKLPKRVKRARTADQEATQKASAAASRRTATPPTKGGKEQRDLSDIIQEAAKGVYLQGEKWGVAKALRGAVQGIQATNTTPRRATERSHWSLDNGRVTSDSSPAELLARIEALEHRNKALAKLLENTASELWTQQAAAKEKAKSGGDDDGDDDDVAAVNESLGLAAARVQFVQVHLENSSMILPSDDSGLLAADEQKSGSAAKATHKPSNSLDGVAETEEPKSPLPTPTNPSRSPPRPTPPTYHPTTPQTSQPISRPDHPPTNPAPPSPSPSPTSQHPRPRPALAESPYSWMLGEDEKQRKSGFVAASPLAAGAAAASARGNTTAERKGSLFGEDEADGHRRGVRRGGQKGSRHSSSSRKRVSRKREDGPNGKREGDDDNDDGGGGGGGDDVFTVDARRAEAER